MINEEFRRLVLEKLVNLEAGQNKIKKDIKSIMNQTTDLSEFRYETNDKMAREISTLEIGTSKKLNDISMLKAAK